MTSTIQGQGDFEVGDAVITVGGRIGRLDRIFQSVIVGKPKARVQFGAGGPFRTCSLNVLRWATKEEVVAADAYGTGFNIRIGDDR